MYFYKNAINQKLNLGGDLVCTIWKKDEIWKLYIRFSFLIVDFSFNLIFSGKFVRSPQNAKRMNFFFFGIDEN